MHAKLPAMMIVREIHSSTTSAIGLTVKPVRAASNSLIVGRSVNVKIVPSTAHQTISRTKAHGTPGRREVASSIGQTALSGCGKRGRWRPHCYKRHRPSQERARGRPSRGPGVDSPTAGGTSHLRRAATLDYMEAGV